MSSKRDDGVTWWPSRVVFGSIGEGCKAGCGGNGSDKIIAARWDKGGSNDVDENSCWNTGGMWTTWGGSNRHWRGKEEL